MDLREGHRTIITQQGGVFCVDCSYLQYCSWFSNFTTSAFTYFKEGIGNTGVVSSLAAEGNYKSDQRCNSVIWGAAADEGDSYRIPDGEQYCLMLSRRSFFFPLALSHREKPACRDDHLQPDGRKLLSTI